MVQVAAKNASADETPLGLRYNRAMKPREFCWSCFRRAHGPAWTAAWSANAALGILAASVAFFWRPFEAYVNLLVGLIPLAIFLVLVFVGLLSGAYGIYRETEARLKAGAEESEKALSSRSEELQREVAALRAQLNKKLTEAESQRIELGRWIKAGEELLNEMHRPRLQAGTLSDTLMPLLAFTWPVELTRHANGWVQKVDVYVGTHCPWFLQRLQNDLNLPAMQDIPGDSLGEATRLRNKVANRLERLRELIAELEAASRP
jgi:hypothetical protein